LGQLAPDDPRARFRARGAATFIAVAEALRTAGLSTPEVYASEPATGLVVMEDFGSPGLAVDGEPDPARYAAAIDALVRLHAEPRADRIPSKATDGEHVLPRLTGDALRAELTLFANAYAPMVRGAPLTDPARADLLDIWSALDRSLQETEQGWVLFDVQSPNLFWLPERSGIRRVGLIDFQDMFFGPTAYDVASLVQDARVTVPDSLALRLVQQYVSGRTALVPSFDHQLFVRGLWIGAALRQSKNLGALSHMVNRGKTNYASHLPRLRAYLERALSHPVLSDLSVWYDTHLTPKNQVAP
jgi:aminoglycoside/choline kinase family phosphotransferase